MLPLEYTFLFACGHAALAGLRGQPRSDVSAAEASSHAETAMALLHRAAEGGYRFITEYRRNVALDSIRDRSDFRLLIMDLAMPAQSFATRE